MAWEFLWVSSLVRLGRSSPPDNSPVIFRISLRERLHWVGPEALRGPLADASGDGVPNRVAAFVGRDVLGGPRQTPVMNVFSAAGPAGNPPIVIHVPEGVEFVPASQPSAIWSGHRITIEAGTSLDRFDFPAKVVLIPAGLPAPPPGYSQRAFALNGAAADRAFFRLRVEAEAD
jgi:hypothetical protein